MLLVLIIRQGGLSLPGNSLVRLTDRPEMTIAIYRGCETKQQQQQPDILWLRGSNSREARFVVF